MVVHEHTSKEHREPRWPASVALAVSIALYVLLPDRLVLGPRWLMPVLEGVTGLLLTVLSPFRTTREEAYVRGTAIGLIGLVSLANGASVALLVDRLINGPQGGGPGGKQLVLAALSIWLTNIIVFGLWYWELDRGGPGRRAENLERNPDFLFPQMTTPTCAPRGWFPGFVDYLYVALTNAAAFSPTDTMPLTPMAKALMSTQSLVSLLTVVVVAARAVNILH